MPERALMYFFSFEATMRMSRGMSSVDSDASDAEVTVGAGAGAVVAAELPRSDSAGPVLGEEAAALLPAGA